MQDSPSGKAKYFIVSCYVYFGMGSDGLRCMTLNHEYPFRLRASQLYYILSKGYIINLYCKVGITNEIL